MSKLEQQVTNLELSKRLKELGVKQESLFYWRIPDEPRRAENADPAIVSPKIMHSNIAEKFFDFYSAFTVAELGEMLPYEYAVIKEKYGYFIFRIDKETTLKYNMVGGHQISLPEGITEADARAKMLIYLLENNLINLKE